MSKWKIAYWVCMVFATILGVLNVVAIVGAILNHDVSVMLLAGSNLAVVIVVTWVFHRMMRAARLV